MINNVRRYGSKTSDGTGRGITVYVVDSGIRTSHQEFISAATGQKRATFGCALSQLGPLTADLPCGTFFLASVGLTLDALHR